MKKSVYIAGTSKVAYFIQDLLNSENVIFLGYVSLNQELENQAVRGGYPLISMNRLKSEQYDYLLFSEDTEFDKSDDRNISLFNCMSFLSFFLSPEYYLLRKKALSDMNNEDACGIVTGMSYVQRGLIPEHLTKRLCMCAAPCQDLYYDFFSLADALRRMTQKLKYVVMGISPYSFRYDLSLSQENSARVLYYYREFGETHNFAVTEDGIALMERYDKVFDEICYPEWRNIVFDLFFEDSLERNDESFSYGSGDDIRQEESLEKMRKIGNKPYPETVAENEMIFGMFLELCARHGIKTVVLIPPFSRFFREHFPMEYVEEARAIIRSHHAKYEFEVLDMYDSPEFLDDKYFADEDHLNVFGADKLTARLDEFLSERYYE
ncbi:MAG: hypothetical protein K5891_02710 [Lachnospiraceae bacterium]|nr:hypothetical protein [Lachnospiraceae bacterium]